MDASGVHDPPWENLHLTSKKRGRVQVFSLYTLVQSGRNLHNDIMLS